MTPEKKISGLFKKFHDLNVMIIGDVMIDAYLWGNVERISPEAPVPIVSVRKRSNRLGGAANVALNIKAMGATPYLCSVIGRDEKARTLLKLMNDENMPVRGILESEERITTTKFRVIGNNTQMLRVDEEVDHPLSGSDHKAFSEVIRTMITAGNIHGIIFQDYDKGVITPALIDEIGALARKHHIPVAVDPKKRNFARYRNMTLFKPNLKELREGLGIDLDKQNTGKLREAVRKLHETQNIGIVLTTLSENGVFISRKTGESEYEEHFIPAHLRNIADVSGAGDTVISVALLCLSAGLPLRDIASVSNLAGGQVCEFVGVAPVDPEKLKSELSKMYR